MRQYGFKESPSYPLREVDAQSISEMCDEFRKEVFLKAQKEDPKNPKKRNV